MGEGELRWKYNVEGLIESHIVVDSKGVVYCGTGYGVSAANDKIVAVNPDGSLKWAFPGPSPWGFYIIEGLCLSNDESVIYAVDAGSDIYALYTSDGTLKWVYGYASGKGEYPGFSGIVVDADDNIYVGGDSWAYGLYSLNYGGGLRWSIEGDDSYCGLAIGKSNTVVYNVNEYQGLREVQLSDGTVNWEHQGYNWGCDGTGIAIGGDGTIYYQDCEYFYAMNPNGSEKWFFPIQWDAYPGAPYGRSNPTAVAVGSDGNIRFGTFHDYEFRAMCLKPDGTENWSYVVGSWMGSGFAGTGLALDANDVVFVGCWDHNLYAVNPDGSSKWIYPAANEIHSGIAFSPNEDTVYFGCEDGYLYAIEKIPSAPTCGIVAVGDKVMLCPIGNRCGDFVALKSGKAALADKSFIAPLSNQPAQKLDFRSCNAKQGDKVICASISRAINNVLGLR